MMTHIGGCITKWVFGLIMDHNIKRLVLILFLVLLASLAWAATYYVRDDGTAANKVAASGPCGTVGNCMSIATHNGETFSGDDVIVLCDDGGVYRDQMGGLLTNV